MFPGSPRKRDGVRVIPLGSVSRIALTGDDPDFIVLEAFNTLFSGTTITLPNDAPIGKVFKFTLTTHVRLIPALTTQYIGILIPLANGVGAQNMWRLSAGQRPEFTYGPTGWIPDQGHAMAVAGPTSSYGIAIGSGSNAASYGISLGLDSNANSTGVAIGNSADGSNSGVAIGGGNATTANNDGVAVGNGAYGADQGVAIGRIASGNSSGVAVGYAANTNTKDKAVAIGAYSRAQRYREFVKSADGAATCKQSFSILDWYGDTTNATQTEIFLGAVNQRALVLASSAYMFKLLAVARDNANNVVSAWEITGAIKRDDANTTALVGAVTTSLIAQDTAAAAWAIAVTADDTAEALAITVTGAAATTIRWNVRGDISELRF